MKKRGLFLAISCLLILVSACSSPLETPPEQVDLEPHEETAVQEPLETKSEQKAQAEDAPPEPEQVTTENQAVEAHQEEKEEFTIIQPSLTYEGAYNGPLYATSEQVGGEFPIDDYMANLDKNGVNWFIGFFTYSNVPKEGGLIQSGGLGRVIYGVEKYPKRIIPYYNPGLGGEEVEPLVGDKLTSIYMGVVPKIQEIAGQNFLMGLGEIETQEWKIAHNDPKVLQLFDYAKERNINFMFHPVASKISQVDKIAKAYPDQKIIIHMYRDDLDKSMEQVIEILNNNENLYFSIDAAHIAHRDGNDILYHYDESRRFISEFDSNYNSMLREAVSDYKPLVEGAPDKVMWGTEAGPAYSFEPEVYNRLIKISRELIGKMNPEYQEGLGYKNALRAFGFGPKLEVEIEVIDSSSWKDCDESQIGECDEECEIPDGDIEDPSLESCFQGCLIKLKCNDVPEQD